MNIRTALTIHGGGSGSGCQGPNCGRPRTGTGEHEGFQTYYHGTLVSSAAKIFQEGLKPKEDYKFINLMSDDDPKGYVYLTKDRKFAEMIAKYRASLSQATKLRDRFDTIDRGWTTKKEEPPGQAAIVTLELPQKIVAKLQKDPDAGGMNEDDDSEKMMKGSIPKKFVSNVESLNPNGTWRQELTRHRIGAAATQKVYLIYYGPIADLKNHLGVS